MRERPRGPKQEVLGTEGAGNDLHPRAERAARVDTVACLLSHDERGPGGAALVHHLDRIGALGSLLEIPASLRLGLGGPWGLGTLHPVRVVLRVGVGRLPRTASFVVGGSRRALTGAPVCLTPTPDSSLGREPTCPTQGTEFRMDELISLRFYQLRIAGE